MEGWSCQNQSEAPHHDHRDRVTSADFQESEVENRSSLSQSMRLESGMGVPSMEETLNSLNFYR